MANMCSSEPGHRAPVAIRGAPRAGSLSSPLGGTTHVLQ
jgi:hypothetical protein